MDDTERELIELRERVARLEGASARGRWWNIVGGIAAMLGASLAALTLWAIITRLSLLAQ